MGVGGPDRRRPLRYAQVDARARAPRRHLAAEEAPDQVDGHHAHRALAQDGRAPRPHAGEHPHAHTRRCAHAPARTCACVRTWACSCSRCSLACCLLVQRYPDKFLPGTDYVASFGVHDDFPGYTPANGLPASPSHVIEGEGDRAGLPGTVPGPDPAHDRGGCHKTEMTHSEQITDTSSLNMFFNDELFSSMVLGTNFFRVAGLETTFAAPPLCRHDPETPTNTGTKGWRPEKLVVDTPPANAMVAAIAAPGSSTADDATPKSARSWIAAFMVVAGGASLVGLVYVTGKKTKAADAKGGWGLHSASAVVGEALWPKAAEEEGMAYRLQTGDAPLLADQ